MEKQVPVDQLSVGMFVSDLDRPWLDTPFLVQGFLIEDQAAIAQLRQICTHVTVDLSRSAVDDGKLPLPAAARPAPVDAGREVARVVFASQAAQPQPIALRAMLSRWLQGLIAAGDTGVQPPPDGPAAAGHRTAPDPAQTAVEAADPAARQPIARAVKDEAPPVASPQAGAPVRRSSGSLGTWLSDRFSWVRSLRRARAARAAVDGTPSAESRLKRSAPLVRIYQDSVPMEQELEHADQSFGRAIDLLGTVLRDIQVGKGLEIEAVESVVEDLVESIVRNPGALQLVCRLREADESAYTYALQVAVLLVSFGRELGFSRSELSQLGQVGMLLDVGKLRVDPRILGKRGNLTAEEFDEVKRHVQHGLDIIAASAVVHADVITGVAQHHERINGSGYPLGLRGDEITPVGQMAGIVDAFSALTSVRPYAEPISAYAAMQRLQSWGGSFFNADLVEQFVQTIGIFPVGTLVELSTGEVAVVLEQNRTRRLKPKVLVISAPDRTPLKIPVTLDLLYGGGATANRVPYIRQGLPAASIGVQPSEYYLSRA